MSANSAKENTYAVFPLQTVLFPGSHISLRIFEQRYLRMISESMREDKPFVISLIEGKGSEVGQKNECHRVACLARVIDFNQGHGGILDIVARAGSRVELQNMEYEGSDSLLRADLTSYSEQELMDLPSRFQIMINVLKAIKAQHPDGASELPEKIETLSATEMSFYLAHFAPVSSMKKQKMLAIQNTEQRLEVLSSIFSDTRFTMLA